MNRYERLWLRLGVGMLVVFLAMVGISAFAQGNQPAGGHLTLDASKAAETPPFDQPGLAKVSDGSYVAVVRAQTFVFLPPKITVPVGSKVHFEMTSSDVVHGLIVPKTNINAMAIPGYVTEFEQTFREPGTFVALCHEYCGLGHQDMQMTVEVVEGDDFGPERSAGLEGTTQGEEA